MKENILEDNQEFKDEVEIKSLIIRESELGIKKNKSCNYKCWIYLFSVLDLISFILLLVYIFAIKSDVLWLFFSFTLVFSITLIILVILKIRKDKKEEE